jgi:pimeloyl-ACP methyl ester carboxylesterase
VGHSLGAVTTAYAAVRRPDLFRTLVLIEPVFLPPHVLDVIRAYPERAGFADFAEKTCKRRYHWPDRQAAFDHFRPKEALASWPDDALWDYVNESLRQVEDGVVLAFSREWEAKFYSQPPLDVWEIVPRLTQPTLAIRATQSDTLFPDAWTLWQQLQPEAHFIEIPDVGHMLTLERPLLTAQIILDFLNSHQQE